MKDIKELYLQICGNGNELSPTWARNTPVIRQFIMSGLSPEALVSVFTAKFDFSIDGVVPWKNCGDQIIPAVTWLSEHYPEVTYSSLSKYFNPIVVRNNLSVNHCQVNIMRYVLNNHINLQQCNSILEIGAGYGAFTRELLLTNRNIKYVIIDLPESLMCSYAYLNLEFPDKKHIVFDESDFIKDFDVLYVPVKSISKFVDSQLMPRFDLFINTCSMGEMINGSVKNYYNLVTNVLKIKYVYWLNRFLDNGTQTEKTNACMVEIPKKWHIKHWERIPLYMQCPYIISYHAKYTELFAEIKDENDVLTSNIDDSLFYLWNVNRLNPTPQTVKDMIKAIEEILPTASELVFYQNLLKNL